MSLITRKVRAQGLRTIALQNENGPCPLVAIVNCLVLKDSPLAAWLGEQGASEVAATDIVMKLGQLVGDCDATEAEKVEILFHFLPQLMDGLDVNPRFDGTFAPSKELEVFSMFNIPLVHGWVLGEVECAMLGHEYSILASQSSYEQYAQLQFSEDPNDAILGRLLSDFVQEHPGQLTPSGFELLRSRASEQPSILFWNNHFSVLVRHGSTLFTLVTDVGYDQRPNIVWEELNLGGAGEFVNGNFELSAPLPDTSGDAALARQLELEDRNAATLRQAQQRSLEPTLSKASPRPSSRPSRNPSSSRLPSRRSGYPPEETPARTSSQAQPSQSSRSPAEHAAGRKQKSGNCILM